MRISCWRVLAAIVVTLGVLTGLVAILGAQHLVGRSLVDSITLICLRVAMLSAAIYLVFHGTSPRAAGPTGFGRVAQAEALV